MRQSNGYSALGRLVIAGTAIVLFSHAAEAADRARFETTVFGGYRYGGDFDNADDTDKLKLKSSTSGGITLNLEEDTGSYYELTYSKQNAKVASTSAFDMSIEYLHLGGSVELGGYKGRVIPYGVFSVGATRFTPRDSEFDRATMPSIAAGAGVKIPFTKHIGLRIEARGYATFVKTDSKLFCVTSASDGSVTCESNIQGHTLLQAQGLVGLTVGF